MRRRLSASGSAGILLIWMFCGAWGCSHRPHERDVVESPRADATFTPPEGTVAAVMDGDTITLADGRHVRYLGIDAPERGQPYHAEARAATSRRVLGQRVRLERAGADERDRYGRILAAVVVLDHGDKSPSVNEELVRLGLASVYLTGPDAVDAGLLARLLSAQTEAIAARRGVWAARLQAARDLEEPLLATRFRLHRQGCPGLRAARPRAVVALEDELMSGKSLCRTCKPLDGR